MKTDSDIIEEGMKILLQYMSKEEVERFVMLIRADNFDYTEWRKNLPKFDNVQELSKTAMKSREIKAWNKIAYCLI